MKVKMFGSGQKHRLYVGVGNDKAELYLEFDNARDCMEWRVFCGNVTNTFGRGLTIIRRVARLEGVKVVEL